MKDDSRSAKGVDTAPIGKDWPPCSKLPALPPTRDADSMIVTLLYLGAWDGV